MIMIPRTKHIISFLSSLEVVISSQLDHEKAENKNCSAKRRKIVSELMIKTHTAEKRLIIEQDEGAREMKALENE